MFVTVIIWILAFFTAFILGATITARLKMSKISKKIEQSVDKQKIGVPNELQNAIDDLLNGVKQDYEKDNKHAVLKAVFNVAGSKENDKSIITTCANVVLGVAKAVNPNSPKPLAEFSIEHTFAFINNVTFKVEEILDYIDMPLLKNMDISKVFGVAKLSANIMGNTAVKYGSKFASVIFMILGSLNPVNWVRRIISANITAGLKREVVFAIISVVAWQSLKLYLKEGELSAIEKKTA